MKPIKVPSSVVDDLRTKFLADAEEGKRKNEEARRLGKAPIKVRCPAMDERVKLGLVGDAVRCSEACAVCNGFCWTWSDGVPPNRCPTSSTPCARPWCWACRNGNRPPEEIAKMRKIFTSAQRGRVKLIPP